MWYMGILILPYPRYTDYSMFHFYWYPCVSYIHFQYLLILASIHHLGMFCLIIQIIFVAIIKFLISTILHHSWACAISSLLYYLFKGIPISFCFVFIHIPVYHTFILSLCWFSSLFIVYSGLFSRAWRVCFYHQVPHLHNTQSYLGMCYLVILILPYPR